MKRILILVFTLQIGFIFAQNDNRGYEIKYKIFLRLGGVTNFSGVLNTTNVRSEFRFSEDSKVSSSVSKDKNAINFELRDTTEQIIVSDLRTKELIETKRLPPQKVVYLVQDSVVLIDWTVSVETKMVKGYLLNKAIGEFRGRLYTAWFAPDLPSVLGPWKFHGLPGVIFEISDSKKELEFLLEEIKTTETFVPIKLPVGTSISRAMFRKKENSLADDIAKSIASKLDRGITVEVKISNVRRIELD